MQSRADITILLRRSRTDDDARDEVFKMVYSDLRRLAGHRIAIARPGQTLSVTALVHEAYLKLTERTGQQWNDRSHFMRIAARALRQICVDHVRAKLAAKRGGGVAPLELDENLIGGDHKPEIVIALEDGLQLLAADEPRLVQVVECRFFAGLTVPETAEALDMSVSTVERDWQKAKDWLKDYLT